MIEISDTTPIISLLKIHPPYGDCGDAPSCLRGRLSDW